MVKRIPANTDFMGKDAREWYEEYRRLSFALEQAVAAMERGFQTEFERTQLRMARLEAVKVRNREK